MYVSGCISPVTQDPEGDFANLAVLIRYGKSGLDVCRIHVIALVVNS